MQTLETILVGGIIAIAAGFLLWTFWPTTGKKKHSEEGENFAASCASGSCGCAGKKPALNTRENATEASASSSQLPARQRSAAT